MVLEKLCQTIFTFDLLHGNTPLKKRTLEHIFALSPRHFAHFMDQRTTRPQKMRGRKWRDLFDTNQLFVDTFPMYMQCGCIKIRPCPAPSHGWIHGHTTPSGRGLHSDLKKNSPFTHRTLLAPIQNMRNAAWVFFVAVLSRKQMTFDVDLQPAYIAHQRWQNQSHCPADGKARDVSFTSILAAIKVSVANPHDPKK